MKVKGTQIISGEKAKAYSRAINAFKECLHWA